MLTLVSWVASEDVATAVPGSGDLTLPIWKTFTIDELPDAIDPDQPAALVVRTDFQVQNCAI